MSPAAQLPAAVASAVGWVRGRSAHLASLWRRSLQLRVVASTLALSSVMLLVLGLALQVQITDSLLRSKIDAAVERTTLSRNQVATNLLTANLSSYSVENSLASALNVLSTPPTNPVGEPGPAGADTFTAVLVEGGAGVDPPASGPRSEVPDELAAVVLQGGSAHKIHTVRRDSGEVTVLAVGMPVPTLSPSRSFQLYLLFPLTSEQQTLLLVQNTLLLGGLLLTLLLAAITSLVTRQVVSPVRQAAGVAERFAEGELHERMPVTGEDDVARLAVSFNEMAASIQRQIRQLEEFGALQKRFTSDVSHELRTPLTTVRMAADTLHDAREGMPPALARSTELLVDEVDRFESLLGDLLEISRHDAGVADLAAETLDLRGVVRSVVSAVHPLAVSSGTEVQLQLPEFEVAAEFDQRRVSRILRNLLGNAFDHGEGRPVQVIMGADDHAVAVLVRDHGVGLRVGEGELVFNRFWRADPSRNRRTGGTGLGLSISLEDARLHGGWLEVWGEPGVGAAFRLTLPRLLGTKLVGSPVPWPTSSAGPASGRGAAASQPSSKLASSPAGGQP